MDWRETDKRIDVSYNRETSFICIEYPGIVQNTSKAVETLGGPENLNKIHSDPNKRLPLCWRPENVYCKPAYADRHSSNSLVMKVRRRRSKTDSAKYEYKVEVLGTVLVTYKFQALSDFQYLPVQKKEDGKYESFYDQVVLNKLTSHNEFFNRDAPLFLPPLMFSRIDAPCDFLYRPDIEHKRGYKNPDSERAPHLIGTVRQKRTIYTIFVNFGEAVPEKPIEAAIKRLDSQFVDPDWAVQIKKLFEEKPLFFKVEIQKRLGFSSDKLKIVLPAVCYYWLDGPWRAQWNKFGFDPTKNIEAKIYQTLDFRIRQFKPGQKIIKPKRGSLEVYRWTQQMRSKASACKISIDTLGQTKDEEQESSDENREKYYKFFPDKLPVQRLTYYQLCHIEVDEVKKLVHSNDGQETRCSEKDGWCVKDIMDRCRDIMYKYIDRLLSPDDTVQQSFVKRLKSKHRKITYIEENDDGDNDNENNSKYEEMEVDQG